MNECNPSVPTTFSLVILFSHIFVLGRTCKRQSELDILPFVAHHRSGVALDPIDFGQGVHDEFERVLHRATRVLQRDLQRRGKINI